MVLTRLQNSHCIRRLPRLEQLTGGNCIGYHIRLASRSGSARALCPRGCFKTVSEKGTVPFLSADSQKLGQSPTLLKQPLNTSVAQRRTRERSEERRVGKECRSRWSPY